MKWAWIILTWNSQAVIGPCIRSIIQIPGTHQIIVIDNGSKDTTPDAVQAFIDQQTTAEYHIEFIRLSENLGTTRTRNMGLSRVDADADAICILDSDTQVNEQAMDMMYAYLQENADAGIVGPKMKSSSGVAQCSGRNYPTAPIKLLKAMPVQRLQRLGEALELPKNQSETAPYAVDYLMSACWLMKPELIRAVGMMDEKIFYAPEDVEYCIRVWKQGYRVVLVPEAQIIHEWQRISKKKLISKMNLKHISGLAYMFRKHRYLLSAKRLRQEAR